MKITHKNKDILQSYVLTTAKYDFSLYEKRVLYRIIEVLQAKLKGLVLDYDYSTQTDLFDNVEFTLPIACFLKNKNDSNYKEVKKALWSLRQKSFEYEDDEHWGVYGIIESPKIKKYDSVVKFTVTPVLMGAFLDFSRGRKKYELQTAMEFESIYSMRFYELFTEQERPLTYGIDKLKEMFKIEGKYKKVNDFIKRVIDPAKKELDNSSPYSFNYKPIKTGRKITSIMFIPYYIPKNRDQSLEALELLKETSIRWDLQKEELMMLKDRFGLTEEGIKNNRELIVKASSSPYFKDFCAEINGMIRKYNPRNKPGYFISELKKKINKVGV